MSILRDKQFSPIAKDITFSNDMINVLLMDGRIISVPIAYFPRLSEATEEQRKDWRLIGGGIGIHWEKIDEDISVKGLL